MKVMHWFSNQRQNISDAKRRQRGSTSRSSSRSSIESDASSSVSQYSDRDMETAESLIVLRAAAVLY